jgi:hypothetical protein
MAYTINGNIPCGTEACTGREHTPAGACNSVYDIILDAIKEVKGEVANVDSLAKEATLIAKVAELKEALNSIDFTAIEQAIQGVRDVTAREATLIQGVGDIIKAVANIDFTDLKNSIAEVKNAVANIDFSALAKEDTLTQGISSVESKVEEVGNKIDNIKLPEIDTTELAKQGDDKNATLTAIYKMLVGNDEPSQDIPEGVAERLALILEFFGIKPIQAYEFMTAEEVCAELEEIMTSMDLDLTPEKAKEITQQTLNN